ncbi:MAG: aconitase X catalytic domain-containing protein, partial [Candidatus Methanospirareceae archaeon]
MYLTREEERIYEGEEGWARKKAMEILVAIGDINDAERLIEIKGAHISGASYKTIGEGVEFIKSLEGGRVKVRSTLNPIGMDIERWREMGISEEFARKQKEVIEAYKKLGVSIDCTCIPYLWYEHGGHFALAESSAVIYANSVLGVRTNMEGAPSALAAALIGKTPLFGLHKEEEREPAVIVEVEGERCEDADYGALGLLIGGLTDKIPMIRLPSKPTDIELRQLSAGIGATGSIGMFHLEGITPETKKFKEEDIKGVEVIKVEEGDIKGFYEDEGEGRSEVEAIAIGCPHCSSEELARIYNILKREVDKRGGGKIRKELLIFTNREVKGRNEGMVEE